MENHDAEQAVTPASVSRTPDLPEYSNNPNISLNLHHGSGLRSLIAAAIAGGVLQFGVVANAGAVTFHPGLRKRVPPYDDYVPRLGLLGFVILASGTVILTLSLAVVCNIIETSTAEREWIVKDPKKRETSKEAFSDGLRVMWIQRAHSVGDQQFDAAVLLAKTDKSTVLTSRRSDRLMERIRKDQKSLERAEENTNIWSHIAHDQAEWATVISTVACLVGFILQFQSFRYVNWSVSLVQLGAIFAMTLVRALLRRGLVARPQALPVNHVEHEIDRLANHLAFDSVEPTPEERDYDRSAAWSITFAYHGDLRWESNDHEASHESDSRIQNEHGVTALAIRSRLQSLTKWESSMRDQARAVAVAIRAILNEYLHDGKSFVWVLDVPGYKRVVQYKIVIERGNPSGSHWRCEDLEITLESLLSLWLTRVREDETIDEENLGRLDDNAQQIWEFIMGPEMGSLLRVDITRWAGKQFEEIYLRCRLDEEKYEPGITANWRNMTVGTRGIRNLERNTGETI